MFKKLFLIGIIVALIAVLLPEPRQALSQSDPAIPPQVIDVWPLPGAELMSGDKLTITFDQPMDQQHTEAAIKIDPALEGRWDWADPQTVTFTPDHGWPRGRSYKLTITTDAKAANQVALEAPYEFTVKTLSNLQVSSISPSADAKNIALDAKIVVTFNHPVIALSDATSMANLPSPLMLQPFISGTGQWVNTSIYAFTPLVPLQPDKSYTIEIPDTLTAIDGSRLEKQITATFHTLPPQVLVMEGLPDINNPDLPTNLKQYPIYKPLYITFSHPMDRPSTEAAFSLHQGQDTIPGKFIWGDDSKSLSFTPDVVLKMDTDYKAILSGSAQTATGGALGKDSELEFHTVSYPAVASVTPANGTKNVHRWSAVTIKFLTAMKSEVIGNYITITPNMDFELGNNEAGNEFQLSPITLDPVTTYTITLKKGAPDVYGNPIQNDYTWSFTTASYPKKPIDVSPMINGDFVITSAARQNLTVPMDFGDSRSAVPMSVYHLPPTEMGSITWINHQIDTY